MIKPFEMIYQKRKMVITNFGFVYINMAIIKEKFKNKVEFIELTDFIKNDEDYTTCINHFSRRVYVDLAKRVVEVGNKLLGENLLSLKK